MTHFNSLEFYLQADLLIFPPTTSIDLLELQIKVAFFY
jgi:hypothetical protein